MMGGKGKVLMLDDETLFLDPFVKRFEHEGYEIHTATSVKRALEILKGGYNPDVVLFDIVMPEENGFAFLEALQREQLAKDAYLIALTNQTEQYDKTRAESLGAMQYVVKATVTPAELVGMLGAIFEHRRSTHLINVMEGSVSGNGKVLLLDDDTFLTGIYKEKFTEAHCTIQIAEDTETALRILRGGFVPDLVLVDLALKGRDGFAFLEDLKKYSLAQGAYLVALTNDSLQTDRERAMQLGASSYIVKATMIPDEVVQKVIETIRQK